MVDRYTKAVLTAIALLLAGLLARPLFEAGPVSAQATTCGAPETPCHVTILGGPPGAWQGAPINVYDAPAEAREQARQMCGTPSSPCHSVIVGGPGSVGSWQGQPVIILDSQRIVPRGRTP